MLPHPLEIQKSQFIRPKLRIPLAGRINSALQPSFINPTCPLKLTQRCLDRNPKLGGSDDNTDPGLAQDFHLFRGRLS